MQNKILTIDLQVYYDLVSFTEYFIDRYPEKTMKQVGDKTKYMKMKIAINLMKTICENDDNWFYKINSNIHGDILDLFSAMHENIFNHYSFGGIEIAERLVDEKTFNEGDYLMVCNGFQKMVEVYKLLHDCNNFSVQENLIRNEENRITLLIYYN